MTLSVNAKYADDVKVYVNGAFIDNDRGLTKGLTRALNKYYQRNIILDKGLNRIVIVAENSYAKSPKVVLNVVGDFDDDDDEDEYIYRQLNLVTIGANSGGLNKQARLNYADDDAKRIAAFYRAKKQLKLSRYKKIITLASDSSRYQEPSKNHVLTSLKAFGKAQEKDLNILYLSGHGVYLDNEYYFVPDGFKRDLSGRIETNSLVSWSTISNAIISAKGVRIIFIDTCYSGVTNLTKIGNELQSGGVYVVSATDNSSKAREYPNIEGGALSYAVLNSLSSNYEGDCSINKTIGFLDFLTNTEKEVMTFTQQKQKPYITLAGKNIPIAMEQCK